MKELFKLLQNTISKLLQQELGSRAGKVNLIGGIIVVAFAAAIFVEDLLIKLLNFALSLLKFPLLPPINTTYILAFLVFILIYFFLCMKSIPESD